jgi:hypothetical protein
VEPDQVDVFAPPVFGHLEEVDHPLEAGGARDGRRDVGPVDGNDCVHLDLALLHPVALADRHVGTHPYADAAGDLTPSYPRPLAFREEHPEGLSVAAQLRLSFHRAKMIKAR